MHWRAGAVGVVHIYSTQDHAAAAIAAGGTPEIRDHRANR